LHERRHSLHQKQSLLLPSHLPSTSNFLHPDLTFLPLALLPVDSIIGPALSSAISQASLQLYKTASTYALSRGIILADTKFEFGLLEDNTTHKAPNGHEYTGTLILIDEVLTPDSSRFWEKEKFQVGRGQESFDKQFVRDWMIERGLDERAKNEKGLQVVLPEEVIQKTEEKYRQVARLLMG